MNRALLPLTVLVISTVIFSCGKRENPPEETSKTQMDADVVLSDSFSIFLNNFHEKPLPAKFPTNPQYNEGDLKQIDAAFAKQFLTDELFEYGIQKVYYHSLLKIHASLHSVVVFQIEENGSMVFALINYGSEGNILSSKTIAHYSNGGGMTSWSGSVIDGERLEVSDHEQDRTIDYKAENAFGYIIKSNGLILPRVPKELITSFHNGVFKNGKYLISQRYGTTETEIESKAFTFREKGDTIIFSPDIYSFNVDAPDDYDLIVNSFAQTENGYRFTMKGEFNPFDRPETLYTLSLTKVNNVPGAFHLQFSAPTTHEDIISASEIDIVIHEKNLKSYTIRKLPFVKSEYSIHDGGPSRLYVGSPDHWISEFADRYHMTHKKENENGEDRNGTMYRVFDEREQLVLEAWVDPKQSNVVAISLHSPLFKIDGGIGIGSTIADVLYAYENITAMSGEHETILLLPQYKKTRFIIEHVSGAPDSEVELDKLDKQFKIARIEFES